MRRIYLVEQLVGYGADLNVMDVAGLVPLHYVFIASSLLQAEVHQLTQISVRDSFNLSDCTETSELLKVSTFLYNIHDLFHAYIA